VAGRVIAGGSRQHSLVAWRVIAGGVLHPCVMNLVYNYLLMEACLKMSENKSVISVCPLADCLVFLSFSL